MSVKRSRQKTKREACGTYIVPRCRDRPYSGETKYLKVSSQLKSRGKARHNGSRGEVPLLHTRDEDVSIMSNEILEDLPRAIDNVDIPLCLSPTSIPPSVPDALPVEYPTPKDGLAHYQTPPSTRGSSSTRSSTSQTSLESTPATDVTMGLVAGVPQLTLFDAQPLVGNVTVSSSCQHTYIFLPAAF